MNIFYLHNDTKQCAVWHNDSHVRKMIIEYAQMLSTAHRILDGEQLIIKENNRKKITWLLPDDRELMLYKATHINHPSCVWVRKSNNNYNWLYSLFCELCKEYTYRYDRVHLTEEKLKDSLRRPPANIKVGYFTQPTPAMDDMYRISDDSRECYIEYYNKSKNKLGFWKNRDTPEWFKGVQNGS